MRIWTHSHYSFVLARRNIGYNKLMLFDIDLTVVAVACQVHQLFQQVGLCRQPSRMHHRRQWEVGVGCGRELERHPTGGGGREGSVGLPTKCLLVI